MSAQWLATTLIIFVGPAGPAERRPLEPEVATQANAAIDRSVAFFRKAQNADGSFADAELGAPITGLVVTGLLRSKRVTAADPLIARALTFLQRQVQTDGGIYSDAGQRNYTTAICLMAFVETNRNKRFQPIIDRAVAYLKREQWDEGEGITPKDHRYGGAGYGKHARPDMSNTAFLLEALRSAGLPNDDPAFQRALLFVSRCQNLSGEGANDLPQGSLIQDGGVYYTPIESMAGGSTTQGLRSYGSMTYAGLKSMIFAGVDKNDRRVQAALGWVREHYSLDENPGLGQQGLYYYYHTFAKALATLALDDVVDAKGKKRDWRADLIRALAKRQNADGSWSNPTKRWLENEPRLVTAYALLALSHALE